MSSGAASAEEILSRVAQAYASLQSYQDRGVVLMHFRAGEPPNETTFETAFATPTFFRFAWVSHHPYPALRHIEHRNVIWFDGTTAFLKSEGTSMEVEIEPRPSLSLAVAGATGVSGGSAHHIARLLMPNEIGGLSMSDLQTLTLEETEEVDGERCHHIRGSTNQRLPVDLWIGAADHLILRIRMRDNVETHRDIRLNETISSSRFSS